jgi:hypothetical protein
MVFVAVIFWCKLVIIELPEFVIRDQARRGGQKSGVVFSPPFPWPVVRLYRL